MAKNMYDTITYSLFSKSGIVVTGGKLDYGKGKLTTPFPHSLNRDDTPRIVTPNEAQDLAAKGFVEIKPTVPRAVFEVVRKALHV